MKTYKVEYWIKADAWYDDKTTAKLRASELRKDSNCKEVKMYELEKTELKPSN